MASALKSALARLGKIWARKLCTLRELRLTVGLRRCGPASFRSWCSSRGRRSLGTLEEFVGVQTLIPPWASSVGDVVGETKLLLHDCGTVGVESVDTSLSLIHI